MTIKISISKNGVERASRTLTEREEKVLLNDLLSIDDWLMIGPLEGKINNCAKRMAKQAEEVLKADPEVMTMPADNNGLIDALIATGHENRAQREVAAIRGLKSAISTTLNSAKESAVAANTAAEAALTTATESGLEKDRITAVRADNDAKELSDVVERIESRLVTVQNDMDKAEAIVAAQ